MGIDRGFNSAMNRPGFSGELASILLQKEATIAPRSSHDGAAIAPRSCFDRDRDPPWMSSEDRRIDSTLKDPEMKCQWRKFDRTAILVI